MIPQNKNLSSQGPFLINKVYHNPLVTSFVYEDFDVDPSPCLKTGDVVIDPYGDVGVVLQAQTRGEARLDSNGWQVASECRYATLKEIEEQRPEWVSYLSEKLI